MKADTLLNGVTYRPGVTLQIVDNGDGRYLLRVNRYEPDSRNPARTVFLPHVFPIPASYTDPDRQLWSDWFTWLAARLVDTERHESREWFKVDGVAWIDPHESEPESLYR